MENTVRSLWAINRDIDEQEHIVRKAQARLELLVAEKRDATLVTIDWQDQTTDRKRVNAAARAAAKVEQGAVTGRISARYAWEGSEFLHQPVYFDWSSKAAAEAFVAEAIAQGLPVVWTGDYRAIAVLPTRVVWSVSGGQSSGHEHYLHRHYVLGQYDEVVQAI